MHQHSQLYFGQSPRKTHQDMGASHPPAPENDAGKPSFTAMTDYSYSKHRDGL